MDSILTRVVPMTPGSTLRELPVNLPTVEVKTSLEGSVSPNLTGWWVAVLVLTLLTLILRFSAINSQSFWYDEAVSAEISKSSYADLIHGRAKDNGNPPLHSICTKAWSGLFGRSEIGFRSFSAVCGVLTVPLLALLGRRLLGSGVGLLAAGLLTISPLHIELSNEARTYALLHLLAVLNMWFFVVWVQRRRRIDLILCGMTAALCWYTHYYAPALQMSQGIALISLPRLRKLLIPWIVSMLGAILLWSPCLPVLVQQLRTPDNLERVPGESWVMQFLATPITFGLGRTFAWRDSPTWLLGLAALGVLVTLLCPVAVGIAHNRPRFAVVLLSGWFLIPILGPLVVAALGKPIYSHRYASIGLPAFLLIAALGMEQFRCSWRATLLGLLVALSSISLFQYATKPLRDDWRSAAGSILAGLDGGELILFDKPIEIFTFRYYASKYGQMPAKMIGLKPGPDGNKTLFGNGYRRGDRIDQESRDYSAEIESASGLWLALCLPVAPPDRYESEFERLGFKLVDRQFFHRVSVLHFKKS